MSKDPVTVDIQKIPEVYLHNIAKSPLWGINQNKSFDPIFTIKKSGIHHHPISLIARSKDCKWDFFLCCTPPGAAEHAPVDRCAW